MQGLPLRCVMCSVLMVNRAAYISHVGSKKHCNKLKRWPEGAFDPVRLASEAPPPRGGGSEVGQEWLDIDCPRLARSRGGPVIAGAGSFSE